MSKKTIDERLIDIKGMIQDIRVLLAHINAEVLTIERYLFEERDQ